MPQIRTFHVPVKSGYKAQVRLLLPPDLAGNEASLYPLVLFADGSPGSQLVTEEFKIHWGTYLSGRRNQIYAWIDGRGSGNQGDKMLNEIYYHLGTAEVQDQIDVIRYLRDNLPFIHPTHIAIWGQSYGGFVAASALAAEDTVFKCAVAIAPITDWIYYTTRGLLALDHVILNHDQGTLTTSELPPSPDYHTIGRTFQLSEDLSCIAALHGESLVVLGSNS
ncbi:venom dipeptidyl peptidase 4 [Trichonephila clavipes]|nr:venom dipeptidyl peptidase 4 [Trichonephila clavipes]